MGIRGKAIQDKTDPTRWKLIAYLGQDSEGVRRRRTKDVVITGKTQEAMQRKADNMLHVWLNETEKELEVLPTEWTEKPLAEYLEWWIDNIAVLKKQRTLESYRNEIRNHIIPALGHMRIADISTTHVQEWIAYELEHGRKGNNTKYDWTNLRDEIFRMKAQGMKQVEIARQLEVPIDQLNAKLKQWRDNPGQVRSNGLSRRTVEYQYTILNAAFRQLVEQGDITFNPCKAAKVPGRSPRDRRAFSADKVVLNQLQLDRFLAGLKHYPGRKKNTYIKHELYSSIYVLAFTGMRLSELLGLTWDCIDWQAKTILIKQSLQRSQDKGIYLDDSVKSDSSERFIKVSREMMTVLAEHRTNQAQTRGEVNRMLFPNNKGQLQADYAYERRFKTAAAKLGHKGLTPHGLRHTHATILIASGWSVKDVSERLGHRDVNITISEYYKVMPGRDEALADHFDSLMRDAKKDNRNSSHKNE